MAGEQRRPRPWVSGYGAWTWTDDERVYAALLDGLVLDRLEIGAVESQMDANSRRDMADILEDQEEIAQEAIETARAELGDFRVALDDVRARGGPDGDAEVPYDASDPVQDVQADILIQYLVRPGYATVRTEEPEPGHFVYHVRVDWPRLRALAEQQGHPLVR